MKQHVLQLILFLIISFSRVESVWNQDLGCDVVPMTEGVFLPKIFVDDLCKWVKDGKSTEQIIEECRNTINSGFQTTENGFCCFFGDQASERRGFFVKAQIVEVGYDASERIASLLEQERWKEQFYCLLNKYVENIRVHQKQKEHQQLIAAQQQQDAIEQKRLREAQEAEQQQFENELEILQSIERPESWKEHIDTLCEIYEDQDYYGGDLSEEEQRISDRCAALQSLQEDQSTEPYQFDIPSNVAGMLKAYDFDERLLFDYDQNTFQHQISNEMIDLMDQADNLRSKLQGSDTRMLMELVTQPAGMTLYANRVEDILMTVNCADVSWQALKYVKALAVGTCLSLKDMVDLALHPIETAKNFSHLVCMTAHCIEAVVDESILFCAYPGYCMQERWPEHIKTLKAGSSCCAEMVSQMSGPEIVQNITRFGLSFWWPSKLGKVASIVGKVSESHRLVVQEKLLQSYKLALELSKPKMLEVSNTVRACGMIAIEKLGDCKKLLKWYCTEGELAEIGLATSRGEQVAVQGEGALTIKKNWNDFHSCQDAIIHGANSVRSILPPFSFFDTAERLIPGIEKIEWTGMMKKWVKYTNNFTKLDHLESYEILYLNYCHWFYYKAKPLQEKLAKLNLFF